MDDRSERNLAGVHAELAAVMRAAIAQWTTPDRVVIVTEGLRTKERQAQLVASGASHTMLSRHLTGHAVDVAIKVGGELRWDWPLYESFAVTVKAVAVKMRTPIAWGGDWVTFRDGPHYELDRRKYP